MRTKMAHILNSVRYTYPTNCSSNLVDIVVDEIFKDGTPICLAAIHDGQITDCINGSPTSSPSTGCSCTATWFGDACNIMCVEGSYNASNNPACICNSGWVGPLCNFRRFYILLKIILFSN
ncbi:uncharacterized protein LOC120341066 [Styela clava]